MWRAAATVGETNWSPAIGMHAAQVAVTDYAPAGWPPHTYTIIRRVRVDTEALSTDPRSRRRRTIDRDQLTPALDGQLDCVWATSFIVTNLPTGGDGFDNATDGEAWFGDAHRHRGPHPRSQARGRDDPPTLGLRREQHRVDVGRADRREPPPPCCKHSPASTPANRATPTATGSATSCCGCPPASSATPTASSCDYPQDKTPRCPRSWRPCGPCPRPAAEHPPPPSTKPRKPEPATRTVNRDDDPRPPPSNQGRPPPSSRSTHPTTTTRGFRSENALLQRLRDRGALDGSAISRSSTKPSSSVMGYPFR